MIIARPKEYYENRLEQRVENQMPQGSNEDWSRNICRQTRIARLKVLDKRGIRKDEEKEQELLRHCLSCKPAGIAGCVIERAN